MALFKRWRRWSARLLRVGSLVSALALAPSMAWSQEGGATDKMPPRHFTKNTSFHLPIKMTPTMRADTREICLYVKQGPNDWVRVETAPPTATHFTPKVSREGEYWFTLVTISKSGRATPPEVAKAPPGLRVVVDVTDPVIDVQPSAAADGEFSLRCNVLDPNFDPATLKAVSKTDKGDRPLETVPGMSGTFRVRSGDISFPVRVTAADRAGNVASKDVNIRDIVVATMKTGAEDRVETASHKIATPPPIRSAPATLPPTVLPASPVPPPGLVEVTAPPRTELTPAIPGAAGSSLPPTVTLPPSVTPPTVTPPATTTPLTSVPPPYTPVTPPTMPLTAGPGIPDTGPTGAPTTTPTRTPVAFAGGKMPRQILNTPQVSIDYRIDQVGPSGVGKVDVYLTADQGQNWKKVKEDMDRRTPVEVELPGEGVFGLKIVITNGNGFGGAPPVRGEQPTCWVEVDSTSPYVVLQPITPITQNGHLEIRWTATDANLTTDPVSLYFRTRPEGPWQAIVRNLENKGTYRWAFPRDMGGQFWVKTEVVDQAGNIARSETPTPIVLDMSEPRASVLGITSATVRPTPPRGN